MKTLSVSKGQTVQNNKIEYDKYVFSIGELLRYPALGLGAGLVICWLCYHSICAAWIGIVVMLVYLYFKKKSLIKQRQKLLLYHFKDFLGALHNALNSGYSIENAIGESYEDIRALYDEKDVMTKEIKIMQQGLRLGRPVEELFENLAQRSGVGDIRLFAELLKTGKRQGGRLGKILSDTRRIIFEKIDTEAEIDKQLTQKKLEHRIMSLMPACIIVYLRLTFSGFIEQLYGNFIGVVVMSICLAAYIGAYFLGERIISIEV